MSATFTSSLSAAWTEELKLKIISVLWIVFMPAFSFVALIMDGSLEVVRTVLLLNIGIAVTVGLLGVIIAIEEQTKALNGTAESDKQDQDLTR